jgi:hypothetical protein
VAVAGGLFGVFALVPVIILVFGNTSDATAVGFIFVMGAPIPSVVLGWAALSRV